MTALADGIAHPYRSPDSPLHSSGRLNISSNSNEHNRPAISIQPPSTLSSRVACQPHVSAYDPHPPSSLQTSIFHIPLARAFQRQHPPGVTVLRFASPNRALPPPPSPAQPPSDRASTSLLHTFHPALSEMYFFN